MKLNETEDTYIEILESCFQTGDCRILFDILNGENKCREKLDDIFSMINCNIEYFSCNLPSTETLVSNALTILTELIQQYGINCENLCVCLSRTILFLIIDEECSIINIKRAINVFNLLIKLPSVISVLVNDARLEGSLQIFGRKLPSIGDYECQALLYEALYRITCDKNRQYWANVWFSDSTARKKFLTLDPQKFESNCRIALNYINGNEVDRRVFSVVANQLFFGSFELIKPFDFTFWIDFNYGSESISFYCPEMSINDSLNDSELWETILITKADVKAFYIKDNAALKVSEVILILNCPCHTLITSSNITNSALNSFQIKLIFWTVLDVYKYLEVIYGREKYLKCPSPENLKISNSSDAIQIQTAENETINACMLLEEIFPQRKISDSSPIPIVTENNLAVVEQVPILARISESSEVIRIQPENIIPDTERAQIFRIAESSEVIEIQPEEKHVLNNYEIHPAPKIYNSQVIHVTPEEEHVLNNCEIHPSPKIYNSQVIHMTPEIDTFQNTNVFQEHSGIIPKRKVSCSSSNIKIKDSYVEDDHDEDGYEHQVIINCGKQNKELTTSLAEKVTALPVKSTSLENSCNDFLMNDVTDKINTETQNNSNYSTTKFVKKSSISSVPHFDSIEVPNKNSSSKENVNSYSARISDRKEFIHTVDKNKAEQQDDKNSENSDVFADVSVIDDSQAEKHKLIRNLEHEERNLNRPSSEIIELPTTLKKRKLRKSSMISDIDNKSPVPYKELSESSKGASDSETAPEKWTKKICLSPEELDESSKGTSNFETVPKKQPRKISLSHEGLDESSKRTSESETVPKKQPRKTHLLHEELDESSKRTSDSEAIPEKQPKKVRLSHEELGESSKRASNFETIPKKQPKKISHGDLSDSSKRTGDSETVSEKQSKNSLSHVELGESSKGARDSETFLKNQPIKVRLSHEESDESSKGTNDSETVHKKQPRKNCLLHEELSESSKRIKSPETVNQKQPEKIHLSHEELGQSFRRISDSEIVGKKQPSKNRLSHKELRESLNEISESETKKQLKKIRLYNLDNAPVYDVPPTKISNKNTSPKESQMEHHAYDLNTDKEDDSGDIGEPNSNKKSDSNIATNDDERVSKAEKMKIYDITRIHESDEDFEGHSFRDFSSRKRKPKTLSSYGARSSKKKKNEASQTDQNKKSTRPTRKAAVNAMKVNKRILDQTSEVACDEIQPLDEKEDNPTNKTGKRRKYSKVFSTLHTDTETGSSEVSWLKQKSCPLFESPKRSFSSWKKNQLRKKSLPVKCAVKCSESSIDNWKSLSLPNINSGSKDITKSAENHKTKNRKNRRAKTDESPASWKRQKDEKLQSPAKDLETENLKYFKNFLQDDLSLRKSFDTVCHENISSVESFEFIDKMKRKKRNSASEEKKSERPHKKSKLHDNISDLKNCTLDPLSLRHSPGSAEGQKSSKIVDNHASGSKTTKKNLDSRNLTEETKLKLMNILDNSLHSKVTTVSFKEVENDKKWFKKITFTLSEDADVLTRKLLATVQKCYCEYIVKMSFLREKILRVTEIFEMSATQNIKTSKLKNLIRTCSVVRAEVEKSLKAMQRTGSKYFEAEEKHYRKLQHKYIKASKKYLLSMQKAQKNAIHELEGNILLKVKNSLRKFMKYVDLA